MNKVFENSEPVFASKEDQAAFFQEFSKSIKGPLAENKRRRLESMQKIKEQHEQLEKY